MKAFVIGVSVQSGTSAKTQQPYRMARLVMGTPMQPINSPKMVRRCSGLETSEVDISDECLEEMLVMRLPAYCEISTEMRPQFGKMVPVVVAAVPSSAPSSAKSA